MQYHPRHWWSISHRRFPRSLEILVPAGEVLEWYGRLVTIEDGVYSARCSTSETPFTHAWLELEEVLDDA